MSVCFSAICANTTESHGPLWTTEMYLHCFLFICLSGCTHEILHGSEPQTSVLLLLVVGLNSMSCVCGLWKCPCSTYWCHSHCELVPCSRTWSCSRCYICSGPWLSTCSTVATSYLWLPRSRRKSKFQKVALLSHWYQSNGLGPENQNVGLYSWHCVSHMGATVSANQPICQTWWLEGNPWPWILCCANKRKENPEAFATENPWHCWGMHSLGRGESPQSASCWYQPTKL